MPEVDRTLSSTLLLEAKGTKDHFYRDFNLKRHYNKIYICQKCEELSLSFFLKNCQMIQFFSITNFKLKITVSWRFYVA